MRFSEASETGGGSKAISKDSRSDDKQHSNNVGLFNQKFDLEGNIAIHHKSKDRKL